MTESHAVTLSECCRRLGMSPRTAERLLREGRFPVPYLRRLSPRAHYKFSTADIDRYLHSSTDDAATGAVA